MTIMVVLLVLVTLAAFADVVYQTRRQKFQKLAPRHRFQKLLNKEIDKH